jgi:hypothetical protein
MPPECPICGSEITLLDTAGTWPFWRCLAAPSHYWQWRGKMSGVQAFLTRPHENKVGAFYAVSPEQRTALLAAARDGMIAQGYTPH